MDINQLEVLATVARERSFSRAAEVLGRTQPAISQSIQRLEAELGETLFDRSSKDGSLTLAGELLVEYAQQILSLKQAAQSAISEVRGLARGKVSVSANEHTVFYLLPLIARFRKLYPGIRVEVRRGVASRIPKEITAREVELGLISFRPDDETLTSVQVFTDELVLIVDPKHRFAKRKAVSVADLGGEDFIAHNAPSPYRQKVIETFLKHKVALNIAVELPSLEAIKRLVEEGAGVALVPKLTTAAEMEAGRLCGLSVSDMKLARNLNFVYRRNAPLSRASQAFLDLAREERGQRTH